MVAISASVRPVYALPMVSRRAVGLVALAHREGVVGEHAAALAVAPLDADHHAVERRQGLLQLQPAQATPAWLVAGIGVLDHQALVVPRPGIIEMPIDLARGGGGREVRPEDPLAGSLGEGERVERRPPLAERGLQQVLPAAVQQVERNEHDRHLGQQLLRWPDAPEPRLERREVEDRPLAPRDELPIDHHRAVVEEGARRRRYLGERARHVIQVAAEEPDRSARLEVELGADTVVLVLDPRLVTDAAHHLGRIGHGGGEHEPDRPPDVQRRLRQPPRARQQGRLADLAGQHVGAPHRVEVRLEGRADGLLEQPFPKPDAGLARDDPADEPRLVARGTEEEIGKEANALLGLRCAGDGAEAGGYIGDRQSFRSAVRASSSPAASPKSEWRRYAARRPSSSAPLAAARAAPCWTQPRPSLAVGSRSGRPAKNTLAAARSSAGSAAQIAGKQIALRVLASRGSDRGSRGRQIGEGCRGCGHRPSLGTDRP